MKIDKNFTWRGKALGFNLSVTWEGIMLAIDRAHYSFNFTLMLYKLETEWT